jgi:putative transposase
VTLAAMVTKYKSVYELNNDYRAKTGSVTLHADFAGDVYEIDSTIVDLWLVARSNRRKTLGKATLYLVVDRLTRLIVGFNLSLDKPSWAGALEAFTSVFADKKALCKQWGAEYNPDVWIATGISCTRLAADRGSENLCYASDQVPDDLKVQVMNMPPHMSSFKGIVECSFKLVHVPLKDNSAGYEPPTNPFKRHGEKCYEKDASMTLDELAVELIDIIGMHNQMMLEQMELDSELVFDGVAPIPLEYWKADIKRQSGSARRMSEEFVRQQLMPRKSARVTQQGILVNHCFYTCPEAIQEEWFIRGKATKVVAEVSYHRGSVNAIYVRYPGRRGPPLVATLAPRSEQFQDWSVAEVYAFDWARRLARKEAAEHNLGLRIAQDARGVTRAKAHRSKTKAAIKAEPGVSRHAGAIEERALETRERTNDYVARTMGLNAETSVLAPHPAPASLPATQPASMPTAVATESSARSHAPAPEPQIDPTATAADLFEQLYNDD